MSDSEDVLSDDVLSDDVLSDDAVADDGEDQDVIGPIPLEPDSDPAAAAAAAALDRSVRSTPKRAAGKSSGRRRTTRSQSRDPLLVGQAVEDLLAERGWTEESAIATLVTRWAQIVGPEIADHVVPVSFTDATLLLQAESTSWATQVRLLLPDLQRVMDEQVGAGVVRQIRVQGPQAPSWSKGSRRVAGRGPRDTYG